MQKLCFSNIRNLNTKILEVLIINFYFFNLCYGMPIYSDRADEDDDDDDGSYWNWTAVVTVVVGSAFIVCLVMTVAMCICCRIRRKEPTIRPPMQNGIQSPVFRESVNTSTEFTIFPPAGGQVLVDQKSSDNVTFDPLPDIHPRRQTLAGTSQKPRPATFSNIIGKGRSLEDWFEDPYSNFPRKQLQYVRELGSGWFGQVVEGEAYSIVAGQKKSKVVVKILMEGANTTDQMCFLHEVKPFRHLNHPNVLKLLGKCLEGDPFLVILEYCAFKDLKSYLIRHRTEAESLLQQDLLLRMTCNVAAGLEHLHDKGFILTDLAARNCLVSSDLNVKVGDYGNSIELFKEDYFCAGGVAVPVRWCAPETLRCTDTIMETREVTQEANIWSFGVVIWEILEFGKLPYIELSDDELIQRVVIDRTEKLKQPLTPCRHVSRLYQIIQLCQQQPSHRPTMDKLHAMLTYLYANRNLQGDSSSEFETRWHQMQPPRRRSSSPARKLSATQSLMGLDFGPSVALADISDTVSAHELSASPHPSLSCDSDFSRPAISPSLQNLRGSLEDLSSELELVWNNSTATIASFSRDSVNGISGGDSHRIAATLAGEQPLIHRAPVPKPRFGVSSSSNSLEASVHLGSSSEKEVSPFTREVEAVIRQLDEDLDRECPSLADATSDIVADEHVLSEDTRCEDEDDDQTSVMSEDQTYGGAAAEQEPPDSLNIIVDRIIESFPAGMVAVQDDADDDGSLDDGASDDDSSWKRIVETSCQESGEITRIIREKSQSVQDFLKLTVIDSESGSDSDGLPSLKSSRTTRTATAGARQRAGAAGTSTSSSSLPHKPLQVRSASLGDVPKAVSCDFEQSPLGVSRGAGATLGGLMDTSSLLGGGDDVTATRVHAAPPAQGPSSWPQTLTHDHGRTSPQLPLCTNIHAIHVTDVFAGGLAESVVKDAVELAFRVVQDSPDSLGTARARGNAALYDVDGGDSESEDSDDLFSIDRRRRRLLLLHGNREGVTTSPRTSAPSRHRDHPRLAAPDRGSGGARPRPIHLHSVPQIVVEECSPIAEGSDDQVPSPTSVYQPKVELNFRFTFNDLDEKAKAKANAHSAPAEPSTNDCSSHDVDDFSSIEQKPFSSNRFDTGATFREPLTSTPAHQPTSCSTPPHLDLTPDSDSEVFNVDSSFAEESGISILDSPVLSAPQLSDGVIRSEIFHTAKDNGVANHSSLHFAIAEPGQHNSAAEITDEPVTDRFATVPRTISGTFFITSDFSNQPLDISFDSTQSSHLAVARDGTRDSIFVTDVEDESSKIVIEGSHCSSQPRTSDLIAAETFSSVSTNSPTNSKDDAVASTFNGNLLATAADNLTGPPELSSAMVDGFKTSNDSINSFPSSDIGDNAKNKVIDCVEVGAHSLDEGFEASDEDCYVEEPVSPDHQRSVTDPSPAAGVPAEPSVSGLHLVPQVTISDDLGGDTVTYDNSSVSSSIEDDCILMVDLETNEAILVDGHRPKSKLAFASRDSHRSDSDDDDDCGEFVSPKIDPPVFHAADGQCERFRDCEPGDSCPEDWNDVVLETRKPESSPGSVAGGENRANDADSQSTDGGGSGTVSSASPLSALSTPEATSCSTASSTPSSSLSSSGQSSASSCGHVSEELSDAGDVASAASSANSPFLATEDKKDKIEPDHSDNDDDTAASSNIAVDFESDDVAVNAANSRFVVHKIDDSTVGVELENPPLLDVATPASLNPLESVGDVTPSATDDVESPLVLSVDTSAVSVLTSAAATASVEPTRPTQLSDHGGQVKLAPLSPDWDVVSSGASSASSSSCHSPSSSSSMSGEFDCSKEFLYENRQEQNDEQATGASDQSEQSCPTGYTIVEEEEDEADYGDDEDDGGEEEDDEETSRSFTASVWDKDAVPTRGVLKTPDKRLLDSDKSRSVSFMFPKNSVIYEYPKEEYEEEEYEDDRGRQMWNYQVYDPQLDYSSYEDWELGNEEIPEDMVEVEDGGSSESSAEFVAPAKASGSATRSLYRLSDIPDEEVYGSEEMEGDASYLSHPDSFDFATYLAQYNNGNPFYGATGGPLDQPSLDGEDFWLKTILNSSDFLVSGSDCPFEFNVGSLEDGEQLPRWAVSPAAYNAYVDLQGAIEQHAKEDDDEGEEFEMEAEADDYEPEDGEGFAEEEEEEEEDYDNVVIDYRREGRNLVNGGGNLDGDVGESEEKELVNRQLDRRTPEVWDEEVDSEGELTSESIDRPVAAMETDSAEETPECNGGDGSIPNGLSNGDRSPVTKDGREMVTNGVDQSDIKLTNMSNGDDRYVRKDTFGVLTTTALSERSNETGQKDLPHHVIAVENT